MKVSDLIPGDQSPASKAVFIMQAPHPVFTTFQLVVWYMPDDTYSFDALKEHQEVGEMVTVTADERKSKLRRILVPGAKE